MVQGCSQQQFRGRTAASVKCCSKNISEIIACSSGSASICAISACSARRLSMSNCKHSAQGSGQGGF